MSEGIPLPLAHAKGVAYRLRDMLLSACERIEVAGSIRREKKEVKDGEFVAIPRIVEGRNLLLELLDSLVEKNLPGGPRKAMVIDKNGHAAPRWGAAFRKVSYSGMNFDIFMVEADSWGYQFWLRTGPDNSSDKANTFIMSNIKWGKKPNKEKPLFRVEGGEVLMGNQRLPVRTEEEFFALLGLPYINPKDRSVSVYQSHFARKDHVWGNPHGIMTIPAPQPEFRLLWNYKADVLAAYPVPLDFYDEDSGMMWANITLDRRNGPFILVEKGSREAAFQREFLVGREQQRVELERLRSILWRDEKIPVQGYQDIGDLSVAYMLADHFESEQVPMSDVIPTQETVYKWGVYIKAQVARRWADWCYVAREWTIEQGYADSLGPAKGLRFAGDNRVFLIDGHHSYMASRELKAETLSVNVASFQETFDQACGMISEDDDNTNYISLAEVMEEAYSILAEGAVAV